MKALDNKAVVAVAVVVMLFPVGYSLVASVFAGGGGNEPFLERPQGHDQCIRPTRYMRFHHMDLLKRLRDEVREGRRGDEGFDRCRECHTARERFCDRCHHAVNLELGCYQCHYYP
ncbi:MAG TPA: hypothetical protein EYP56_15180 [Planctomycetaceae bacterium]|nr:hypothetical protein [Planctomycetaceae bacterium]HIQ21221.1 hypothetical protein [Planctomycetota bacterium]